MHPEDDPSGFLRLKTAYQQALAWAKNTKPPVPQPIPQTQEQQEQQEQQEPTKSPSAPTLFQGLVTEKSLSNSFAFRRFRDLYGFAHASHTWMEFYCSTPFLDIFLHPTFFQQLNHQANFLYNTYNTVAFFYLFLTFQIHPALPNPAPPRNAHHQLRLVEKENPPPLSPSHLAFATGFHQLISLLGESTAPPDKASDFFRNSLQDFMSLPPQDKKYRQSLLLYYLNCPEYPLEFDQIVVDECNLYHSVKHPSKSQYTPFQQIIQSRQSHLFHRPTSYWDHLTDYIHNFQTTLENTPLNQQNNLSFVGQFFQHAPRLQSAIYDSQYMDKKQLHHLIEHCENRLFLSKFLELCYKHPDMIDQSYFIQKIAGILWENTPSHRAIWQEVAEKLLEDLNKDKPQKGETL